MDAPIVVFSHLRWDFVYQRPQHLLSRLAATRPVLYVEEPVRDADPPHWEYQQHQPGVTVCRPHTPAESLGYTDEQFQHLHELLPQLIRDHDAAKPVLWFYTPMAMPLARAFKPRAVVYDCMDELSAFLHAPPQLLEREAELMKAADVVFTGGPSLYRSKKDLHPNVHCFPSSVDRKHFAQALSLDDHDDQRPLPRPRLGFFGVIDERLDIPLLDHLAHHNTDWQITMVGPVVKIDPARLPRYDNLHYLGQRQYADLPRFLAGWDVCLLPFARNRHTQFISPTKTLEYMAAQKPIVSTPITDVAEPYGNIVYLGDSPEAFSAACDAALNSPQRERDVRIEQMKGVLDQTSWDRTAAAMEREVRRLVARGPSGEPRRTPGTAGATPGGAGFRPADVSTLVIGAGPTGLSAAYHLDRDAMLIERNDRVGGWCRSIVDRGFTFDMAGHIMFSKDPYVHELYHKLLGGNVHWQDREAWIYSKGVYTRYPFQGCLYGLPADVITECIVGAIEARFGPLKKNKELEDTVSRAAHRHGDDNGKPDESLGLAGRRARRNGSAKPGATGKSCSLSHRAEGRNGEIQDCCGDGVLEAQAPLVDHTDAPDHRGSPEKPRNFEEFIYKVWGRGIAKHFAVPYNRKLWAVPLSEMETSWLGGRVPMPDLEEMVRYALSPAAKPMGPNARFGYPLRGGFQSLMNGFIPYVQDRLLLNTEIAEVSPSRKLIRTRDGRQFRYEVLISTMPLPRLIQMMGSEAPPEVRRAAAALRFVNVKCVNLGVGRENLTDKHWIYYPEDTVFHRIFVQGNASPHCNPPGGFALTCEITYSPTKPLPGDGQALIRRCIEDCHRVGMFKPDDPIWAANVVDMPMAYVVYDHARPNHVNTIRNWLAERDVILAGRYSEWEYYNSDHAFIAGRNAAQRAQEILTQRARGTTRRPITRGVTPL